MLAGARPAPVPASSSPRLTNDIRSPRIVKSGSIGHEQPSSSSGHSQQTAGRDQVSQAR